MLHQEKCPSLHPDAADDLVWCGGGVGPVPGHSRPAAEGGALAGGGVRLTQHLQHGSHQHPGHLGVTIIGRGVNGCLQ